MSYKEFSYYYDYFNYNADYDLLADKIHSWASAEKLDGKIACDLGCGTGELAIRLNEKGWDVIAVDCSEEMLDVFNDKRAELGLYDILILNQDITKLDMYGTVDLFTCTFDTVNHLNGADDVQKLFDKVSLFMHPDGVFIFDMNSEYKHLNVLGNEKFYFEEEEADCVWQNTLEKENGRTKISICINDKQSCEEYYEEFYEHFYSLEQIKAMLDKSGMKICRIIDGESFEEVSETSQRYLFMVKKEQ
ncbi:MAG: class I SAM-dependent methyltransferase [Oscillospiraceae bacterium]|nr:class I SAM-dependent methyltransferase [Oscillospiraceae bacterium]